MQSRLAVGVLFLAALLLGSTYIQPHSWILSGPPDKKADLSYRDRLEWRKIIGWQNECEQDWQPRETGRAGMAFWPIEESVYLVEVHCGCGAYQCWSEYFLYDESDCRFIPQQLFFADFRRVAQNGGYYAVLAAQLSGKTEFDGESHVLRVVRLGRGLGDCRSLAKYHITALGAELVEFREKPNCDGQWVEDDALPQVYP